MNARIALALVFLLSSTQRTAAAEAGGPGDEFFKNGPAHSFEIQLSGENLKALRIAPREYVSATVKADGQTYTEVGIRLKGVATFRPVDDEPSLTLNFSKFVPDRRFHGLRKIHLNNGKEDPTFLCEAISAEMFAGAGLPAARVTHAHTRLNGRDLGPYVVIEGFTREFLARYFKNTHGNLYDSGFCHDITHPLERIAGKGPDDWQDLKQLVAAAQTEAMDQRWRELEACLDTNSFGRYLAMQVLTVNWDGYALYKNNYRIYHDPDSGRLHFIPHGMDQMFSRPRSPLMPQRWEGLLASAFMETSEGRAIYEQQLRRLFTEVYQTAALVRRVDELADRVRPMFAGRSAETVAQYDRVVAELRGRIEHRGKYLAQRLAASEAMNPPRTKPNSTIP